LSKKVPSKRANEIHRRLPAAEDNKVPSAEQLGAPPNVEKERLIIMACCTDDGSSASGLPACLPANQMKLVI